MKFRVGYMRHGGHVYCRVYASEIGGAFGALGNLTMRAAQFEEFRASFDAEFLDEMMVRRNDRARQNPR